MTLRRHFSAALGALVILTPFAAAPPALADGAASTRNILLGGAAATLIILNHNKKVHEKYAEDARRQADAEQQRDNARAAYASEKRAYENETALVSTYKHEVALQHDIVTRNNARIRQLEHSLAMSKRSTAQQHVASTAPAQHVARTAPAHAAPARTVAVKPGNDAPSNEVSYGWGTL